MPMDKQRLIDAGSLENSIQLSIESWGRDCNSNAPVIVRTYKDVLSRIKYIPTVDAVEVVHGRWEIVSDAEVCGNKPYRCTNCISDYWMHTGIMKRFLYCPFCGAKMDGERKDNEH